LDGWFFSKKTGDAEGMKKINWYYEKPAVRPAVHAEPVR
jgi:hypothetical protein